MAIDQTLTFFAAKTAKTAKTAKVPWLRVSVQLTVAVAMVALMLISLDRALTSITWQNDAGSSIGWETVKHGFGVILFAASAIVALLSAIPLILRRRRGIVCRLSRAGIEARMEQDGKFRIVPWSSIVTLEVASDDLPSVKLDFDVTDQSGTRRIDRMLDGSATTQQGLRLADWVIANPVKSR